MLQKSTDKHTYFLPNPEDKCDHSSSEALPKHSFIWVCITWCIANGAYHYLYRQTIVVTSALHKTGHCTHSAPTIVVKRWSNLISTWQFLTNTACAWKPCFVAGKCERSFHVEHWDSYSIIYYRLRDRTIVWCPGLSDSHK